MVAKGWVESEYVETETEYINKIKWEVKKETSKRYVIESVMCKDGYFWEYPPVNLYIKIKASNDEEAYQKAAAFEMFNKNSEKFRIVCLHGLKEDFSHNKHDYIKETLEQKTTEELRKIIEKTEFFKEKKEVYDYLAGIDIYLDKIKEKWNK